jgi:hypothetical protein
MCTSDIIILLSCHNVGMGHMASGQTSITERMGMPSTQSNDDDSWLRRNDAFKRPTRTTNRASSIPAATSKGQHVNMCSRTETTLSGCSFQMSGTELYSDMVLNCPEPSQYLHAAC